MLTIQFGVFPSLTTRRIQLRSLSHDDAQALFDLRTNEQYMQYLDKEKPTNIEEIIKMIEQVTVDFQQNNAISWAMCYLGQQQLVGTVSFHRIDKAHHRAEIGYGIHPDHFGKGLMQEVMPVVIDYGFNQLNLHSIEANVNPHNKPSIKLLERHDFVREAYFKENYYFNGQFLDTYIYSLVKRD